MQQPLLKGVNHCRAKATKGAAASWLCSKDEVCLKLQPCHIMLRPRLVPGPTSVYSLSIAAGYPVRTLQYLHQLTAPKDLIPFNCLSSASNVLSTHRGQRGPRTTKAQHIFPKRASQDTIDKTGWAASAPMQTCVHMLSKSFKILKSKTRKLQNVNMRKLRKTIGQISLVCTGSADFSTADVSASKRTPTWRPSWHFPGTFGVICFAKRSGKSLWSRKIVPGSHQKRQGMKSIFLDICSQVWASHLER